MAPGAARENAGRLHTRSHSRAGKSDVGTNARLIKKFFKYRKGKIL